jgi:NADH:ubiquinone oxidoreductase subunit E
MKVSVKICSGTACYIMGGAKLLEIGEYLTENELKKVKIEGSSCLKVCDGYNPDTPFAMINDEIIPKANIELLVKKIKIAISELEN